MDFDASFTPEQLEQFNSELKSKGYRSSYRQLSAEEIKERETKMEQAKIAIERAMACPDSW